MTAAIQFEHVAKRYRLGGQTSLRETIAQAGQRLIRRNTPEDETTLLWALQDIDLEVQPGEALGVVGSNGAGKTTMLKLLSRVTRPTRGRIQTNGRIAALIELGAGFHADLTGRENVFLYGAILGLSQAEIRKRFDQIVAFAELERFIDTPVKRYSSGMYARLGFAVAAHVDPEVLLIDEVLAVGDMSFQRKCHDFIRDFAKSGRTAVFVSHNLYTLEQLCEKIAWLDHGHLVEIGSASQILSNYMDAEEEKLLQAQFTARSNASDLKIETVYSTDNSGAQRCEFQSGEDLLIHLEYTAPVPIPHPHFVVAVWDATTRQPVFIASMLVDNQAPDQISGHGHIVCHFYAPPLMPRTYQIWGEVWSADRTAFLLVWQPLVAFRVIESDGKQHAAGGIRHSRADAPVRVHYEWSTTDQAY